MTSRGRIDKREAILEAAFRVFARDGYTQACVRDIAAEANVAKPTIYSHLTDKATLFHEAVAAAATREREAARAAIAQLDHGHPDPRATLERAALGLLRHFATERSRALRRLLHAEIFRFPELLDTVQGPVGGTVEDALADRLARLATANRLRFGPVCVTEAAQQFLALLTGPHEARSALGTRPVPATELRAIATRAVHTFLLAFGAPESGKP